MSDKNAKNASGSNAGNELVVDPVCGMTIEAAAAVGTEDFEGQRYSFCSHACKEKFEADPRRYARPGAGASG